MEWMIFTTIGSPTIKFIWDSEPRTITLLGANPKNVILGEMQLKFCRDAYLANVRTFGIGGTQYEIIASGKW